MYGNDALNRLSNAQAITVEAVSTNKIKLGAVNQQIGNVPRYIKVNITAFTSGLDSGIRIKAVDDDNADLSSPREVCSILLTAAQVTALVDKQAVFVPIPPGVKLQQYLGAQYSPVSEAAVGLTVTTYVTDSAESDVLS